MRCMLVCYLAVAFLVGCAVGMMAKNRKTYDPRTMVEKNDFEQIWQIFFRRIFFQASEHKN